MLKSKTTLKIKNLNNLLVSFFDLFDSRESMYVFSEQSSKNKANRA